MPRALLLLAVLVAFVAGWHGCARDFRAMAALLLCCAGLVLVAHVVHEAKARAQLLRHGRLGRAR